MASKTYKSVTGKHITFPVTVSDVKHWIELNPSYTTTVTGIQSAIEAKNYFTSGAVMLLGNYLTQLKSISDADVAGGAIATSEINAAGTGYVVEDVITFTSTGKDAVIKVTAVDAGAVTAYEVIEPGTAFTAGDKAQTTTDSTEGAGFELTVLTVTAATVFPEGESFKAKDYTEVTNINQAIAVLKAEPYKVHHMKLKNLEAVMAQAIEHSVNFPNLVL